MNHQWLDFETNERIHSNSVHCKPQDYAGGIEKGKTSYDFEKETDPKEPAKLTIKEDYEVLPEQKSLGCLDVFDDKVHVLILYVPTVFV